MFDKIKKKLNMENIIGKLGNNICGISSSISLISEDINITNERLKNIAYDLDKLRGNLEIFKKNEAEDISGLNKKTELLFKQIDSTNRLIYAYVQEQLFNIEKIRLEMKRENLMHYINEEITEKRIMWITALPWYKKITKKQQIRLIVKMQEIHDDVYKKYDIQLKAIDLEIKNHTRENFSLKLTNVTKEIKNNQKGEK